MTTLFEEASRTKLRFASNKGPLMAEQLWDLPLTSKSGFSLDDLARDVHKELKELDEVSFVATSTNPAKPVNELRMAILKHIIAIRVEENRAATERKAAQERVAMLEGLVAERKVEALKNRPVEELEAELARAKAQAKS